MRFDRQQRFKEIGKEGLAAIEDTDVVVVGVGTTGCLTAELLVRAGFGCVTVLDHDVVEESNLHGQTLFDEDEVGVAKVDAAVSELEAISEDVDVVGKRVHVCPDTIEYLDSDIVIDCTDNLYTRFVVNDYCVQNSIPWVYGGAAGSTSMVYVTDGSPCFACAFDHLTAGRTCHDAGVLNAAGAFTSSLQVAQAIRLVTDGSPDSIIKGDVWSPQLQRLDVSSNADCSACNGDYEYLNPSQPFILRYCAGRGGITARPTESVELDLDAITTAFPTDVRNEYMCRIKCDDTSVTVYDVGEVECETGDKDVARSIATTIYEHRTD